MKRERLGHWSYKLSVGVQVLENDGELPSYRLVLLHDTEGKVLVFLPVSALLDLVAVWKATGRQLQPVRALDAKRYFSQEALQYQEAQAKLLGLPKLVAKGTEVFDEAYVIEPHSGLNFTIISEQLADAKTCDLALGRKTVPPVNAQTQTADVAVITKAVERFTSLRIQQRLEDTLSLPSFSSTLKKIIMLRSDPEAGVDDLVPVVKVDPSLAAQVMSWSASPYYAAPGKVSSVDDAVIRVLGFDLVINMALGTAMGQMLRVPDDTPRGATPYWLQAVYNAVLAEKLCRIIPVEQRPKPGLAYLAALLHNFGYLVLAHLFPPHFTLLSRYIEANPHFPLCAIEQQVLSVTREQIGSWLLRSWDIPEEVCEAIRFQNELSYDGKHQQYAKLLYLANRRLRQEGLSDGPIEPISDDLYISLGLDQASVDKVVNELLKNDEDIRALTEMLEGQS